MLRNIGDYDEKGVQYFSKALARYLTKPIGVADIESTNDKLLCPALLV
jgi:hypothetical protein